MSQPTDIAVDLGAVPEPLPKPQTAEELIRTVGPAPPQLVRGLLHVGGKMTLNGTSKSNKSWSLLDLALSVSTGQEWWGHRCEKLPAIYINFELHDWAVKDRVMALQGARPECANKPPFLESAREKHGHHLAPSTTGRATRPAWLWSHHSGSSLQVAGEPG